MKKAICFLAALPMLFATSCLDDNETDYAEWKEKNEKYVTLCADSTVGGVKIYEKVTPAWAPNAFVLMKWHNNRLLTASNLMPLDNSTVDIKYRLRNIEGTVLDSSYTSTTYGDSIYRTQPNTNVIGFWTGLTNMHVGDSVTMVVPYQAGYGSASQGSILPFSTLIFDVKLKSIYRYETPNN